MKKKGKVGTRKKSNARKAPATGRKIKPASIFIYALALAALGGGGYLTFQRLKRKKLNDQGDPSNDTIVINNNVPASFPSGASSLFRRASADNDTFPLKRGSSGARVTMLQRALAQGNSAIKIDGQFGPATANALRSEGYPDVVDQTLFNKITGSTLRVVFNPVDIAGKLYRSAQAKRIDDVIATLKEITSVQEYSSVNDRYKKQSFFISRTIVTDLLDYVFKSDESAKDKLRQEFLRIGLKISTSGRWSLQGIKLFKDLITLRDTIVIDQMNNRIPVKQNTILGDEVDASNGMTWFKSLDCTILRVPTQDVKYT